MKNEGLTLLELILALTMLSIILVASGSLNIFLIRAANLNAEEVKLQNHLEYVFKDLEVHLLESRPPKLESDPAEELLENLGSAEQLNVIQEKDPSTATDNQVVRYWFGLATHNGNALRRCVQKRIGESVCVTISEGLLMKKPGSGRVFEVVQNSKDRLIRVNLAVQTERNGKKIAPNGASRLFFMRGADPTA